MEVKDQRIEINTAPVDSVGGAQPEPEERPAELKMDSLADVAWGAGQQDRPLPQAANKSLPATITAPGQVQDMLETLSTCATCKWFNHKRGQKIVQELKLGRSYEDRCEYNTVLLALCPTGPGLDPEQGLPFIGACDAVSRYMRDNGYSERESQFLTAGECHCPKTLNFGKLKGQPVPNLHRNVNTAVARLLQKFRDGLRYMASGR